MGWSKFVARLAALQQERQTRVALVLNPRPFLLPALIQQYDDPYLPFGKTVIGATRDLVCAYVFDLASYLGMGAAGAVALERTIAYAGQDTLTILDGPFTGTGYSATADTTGFGVDAITLTRATDLTHYLAQPPYAAFVTPAAPGMTLPEQGGLWEREEQRARLRDEAGHTLRLILTDDGILYGDGTVDFTDRLWAAVDALRRETWT